MFSSSPPTMPVILGTSESIYGFDPRSLGGCVLWLDGADAGTLFSDTGGTVAATVTGQVRVWKDKSGQGNNFSNRSYPGRFPIYASGGGVFISNASTPNYNATTFNCLESVNSFMTFPYYTIYTVVNATAPGTGNSPTLPTLFTSVRNRANVESRSPYWGMGGHFSLGSPTYSAANSRFSFGNTSGNSAGEQISNLVTTVAGLTSGRLSNTTSLAGTRVASTGNINYTPWTTCTAPPSIGASFYLYDAGTPDQTWLNGTIFETLVFNSELTRGQCEEIEGYLSWKWGRQTALPTTHPFRNIAPLARGFTPIDIPGCVLWLDGADSSTIFTDTAGTTRVTADGNTIGSWRDKSTNSYLFTQATAGNRPTYKTAILNGQSITRWNGTSTGLQSSTTLPFYTSASSGGSFFFVFMVTSNTTQRFLMTYQNQTSGTFCVSESEIGCPTGNVDTGNFGIHQGCGKANVALNQVTTNQYMIMNLNLLSSGTAPANTTIFKNGTSASMTAQNGGFYSGTTYPFANNARYLNIGYRVPVGVFPIDCWLAGDIAEIIWYPFPLTTVQRQAVEGYLAHKWGLTASLSTSNILRSFPPSSVQQFKPTDINACSLWLDAADLTGSTISTWTDKSGNGSNATANAAITVLANAVNGNNVLSVDSGTARYLNGSISITGTGLTVISAFRMDSGSSAAARIIGLGVAGANDSNNVLYVGIRRQTNNNMGAFRNGSYAGPTLTYGVPAISTTYFDGANGYSYINGGTASSFASTANFGITSYSVMANTSNADTQYFTGYMCEMIVYNSTLTLAERRQVEGYLSKKWAIALATTHPYYAINPAQMVGGTAIITPSNLPGLIVWNRGDTLAGANGSTVGTWTNSSNASGPTISCSGTQSNAALNGRNVVNFTTAQTWTSSPALTPSSYTFIQVSRQTPSTYGRMFQSSVAGTNQLHGYWNSLKQPWFVEGWLGVAGGGVGSAANEWAIISSTRIQNGAFQNRWNGAVVAAGASSANVNLSGLAVNTGGLGSNETSTCQIAEVILYSNVLTTPQIIGIEEYLRQKWGLGLN